MSEMSGFNPQNVRFVSLKNFKNRLNAKYNKEFRNGHKPDIFDIEFRAGSKVEVLYKNWIIIY